MQPGRFGCSRQLKREFWRLIATGMQTDAASQAIGLTRTTGTRWFGDAGGVPPIDLAEPSRRFLSIADREEIAVLRGHASAREIARRLHRAPSTIVRELSRNTPEASPYRAVLAQSRADRRATRPKASKLATCDQLRNYVQEKLSGPERWSPEQISCRMQREFPDDDSMRISHEAIYQALYVQGRGGLRRELAACLRTGRALRKPRRRVDHRSKRIKDMVMISERPAEAADRAVPGHWEGDLIVGKGGTSAIGTLVERTTRFTMLVHLPSGHDPLQVRDALATTILTLPEHLRRSLTWDQGWELMQHVQFSVDTDVAVYFCDPHSPWQRGSNENTNGLLRQYFPKGSDLSVHTLGDVVSVAVALNGRPRKTLGWRTPDEAFAELLAG